MTQCNGITKNNTQCKKTTSTSPDQDHKFCYQHQNCQSISTSPTKEVKSSFPSENAILYPIGTEKHNKYGAYIVKKKSNGSRYWVNCNKKGADCISTKKILI